MYFLLILPALVLMKKKLILVNCPLLNFATCDIVLVNRWKAVCIIRPVVGQDSSPEIAFFHSEAFENPMFTCVHKESHPFSNNHSMAEDNDGTYLSECPKLVHLHMENNLAPDHPWIFLPPKPVAPPTGRSPPECLVPFFAGASHLWLGTWIRPNPGTPPAGRSPRSPEISHLHPNLELGCFYS